MERLLENAASLLAAAPDPALPLSEVEGRLSDHDPPVRLAGDALIRWLSLRGDLFLLVDPWEAIVRPRLPSGPRHGGRDPHPHRAAGPGAQVDLETLVPGPGRPMVIALSDPCGPLRRWSGGPAQRLRDSMVWISRHMDRGSGRATARWLGMIWETGEVMAGVG